MDTFICTVTRAMTARPILRTHRPCRSAKWKSRGAYQNHLGRLRADYDRTRDVPSGRELAIDKNLRSKPGSSCSKNLHRHYFGVGQNRFRASLPVPEPSAEDRHSVFISGSFTNQNGQGDN
jgi:hypothetical protein